MFTLSSSSLSPVAFAQQTQVYHFAVRLVASNKFLSKAINVSILVRSQHYFQRVEIGLKFLPRDERILCAQDLGMHGRLRIVTKHQLFVSFSPGRSPVITMSISPSGLDSSRSDRPESSIMRFAKSAIFTDSPISSTNTSPPLAMAPA